MVICETWKVSAISLIEADVFIFNICTIESSLERSLISLIFRSFHGAG